MYPAEQLILLIFITLTGLCIGSFLNVVILRTLSGESIVFPPSKCPKCGNKLKWWHNIPVLSYIFLGGKCGFCKEKISIQYPIVELITCIIFVMTYLKLGFTLDLLFALIFFSLLIVIAGTDIKEKAVYDVHTHSLIIIGLVYALILTGIDMYGSYQLFGEVYLGNSWFQTLPVINSLLGLFTGAAVMEIAARIGYPIAGNRAFGDGDTFIAAGIGALFGWRAILLILAVSIGVQVVMTLPVYFKKLYTQKEFKTLISLTLFLIAAIIYGAAQYSGIIENTIIYLIAAVILAVIGLYACKQIITGLKNADAQTYLPFGPAMVIATLLVYFLWNGSTLPF